MKVWVCSAFRQHQAILEAGRSDERAGECGHIERYSVSAPLPNTIRKGLLSIISPWTVQDLSEGSGVENISSHCLETT